ncbi:cytochrome P450 [Coniella lustricola]|uniref:Cytochrome P450 n=1 Tax=Coniella lustricola TaxID=2025994 RepID=A0A2T2ZSN3_9PEZI|nr:cytochrome P450 [Coniella lustricola]
MEHLHSSWPLVSLVNESYWARKMFYSDWFLSMFGSQVTDAAGIGKVRSFVVDIVSERFRKHEAGDDVEETKKDMLSSWMKHGLTQTQCDAESLLALVAGSETSASVIRMTLLCLLTNPAAYRRLQETVRETLKRGDVSEPISFAQAKAIPYVKAVVYEGMRMRPGTQGTFPKIVPPQGETVQGGVFLPGGTRVGMNVPAVLRNEQVFGAHPAAFRPERWLDPQLTPAKVAEMEQATELVFGTGRWMCAGKPIALMELYKVFFELARNFEFGIANPIQPMETTCYNVYVDRNFWVWATDVAAKA